jgi:Zn-dependent alcohol dehydrogenase
VPQTQERILHTTRPGILGYGEGEMLDELITRRYQLEQINEAGRDLEERRILGRSIIVF